MNEYFASSADVHRILGALPEGADKMPTADGREKTVEASRARLARMIGREAHEAEAAEWDGLAAWFAEAQIRNIVDAALLRLSRCDLAAASPVVAAGIGEGVATEVARRLRSPAVGFSSLIDAPAEASHCAPAVAVALLAGGVRPVKGNIGSGRNWREDHALDERRVSFWPWQASRSRTRAQASPGLPRRTTTRHLRGPTMSSPA